MIMDTLDIVQQIVPTIAQAIDDAVTKHGPFTTNLLRAQAILTEEVGELAEAILGVTKTPPYKTEEELFTEAIHVAAVAVMIIMGLSNAVPVPEPPNARSH